MGERAGVSCNVKKRGGKGRLGRENRVFERTERGSGEQGHGKDSQCGGEQGDADERIVV